MYFPPGSLTAPAGTHRPKGAIALTNDHIGGYRLIKKIATGPTGVVWQATSPRRPEPVVVKVLRDDLSDSHDVLARFMRLRRGLPSVRHANLAPVFELLDDNGRLGIATELLDGPTLATAQYAGVCPSIDNAISLVLDVANALTALHQANLVHAAVKPSNIWLQGFTRDQTSDGSPRWAASGAKLADHATTAILRSQYNADALPAIEHAYGSPGIADRKAVPSDDVYGLGVVLYELLAGHHTHSGPAGFDHSGALAVALSAMPDPEEAETLTDLIQSMVQVESSRRPPLRDVINTLTLFAPVSVGARLYAASPSSTDDLRASAGVRLVAEDEGSTTPVGATRATIDDRIATQEDPTLPTNIPASSARTVTQPAALPYQQPATGPANHGHYAPTYQSPAPSVVALNATPEGIDGDEKSLTQRLLVVGAVVVLVLVSVGILSIWQATNDTQASAPTDEVATDAESDANSPAGAADDIAGPEVESTTTVAPEPLTVCCWEADFDPSPAFDGTAEGTMTFVSSSCATALWVGPDGRQVASSSWPDAKAECWSRHTETFSGLVPGDEYAISVQLAGTEGQEGEDKYQFTVPNDALGPPGPSISNWQVDVSPDSAHVTFSASSCATAAWIDPTGEEHLSPGWPDPTVNCWVNHGRTFEGLSPNSTYTVNVRLVDEVGGQSSASYSFTTSEPQTEDKGKDKDKDNNG